MAEIDPKQYNPREIEAKWQKKWLDEKVFAAHDESAPGTAAKPKYYQLETFPYPSGAGLHVGHPKGYIAEDIHARFMRMGGDPTARGGVGKPREVLYTMGWDAFGLPTENYAIKVGKTPQEVTQENTDNFRRQVRMFGLSYDWDREINTSQPDYYKWTQWLFIKLFERGLAYRKAARVNWCPVDQTVLANEQVINGHCDRCGSEIEERDMEQWFFKITDYADRLLEDLDGLDWPAATIKRQEDWIGKSEGAEIEFSLSDKHHYVLLHGFTGSPDNNFFPWLKKTLEKQGHTVEVPSLPNTDDPDVYEQVKFVLDNCHFDESTIIVGHSLGAVVALKVLEQLPKPIFKTVLAAGFAEPGFKDHDRPFENKFDWKFDFARIKENARDIILLRDVNDTAVKAEQINHLHNWVGGIIKDITAKEDHFCALEETEILKAALDAVIVFTTRPDTLFGVTYLVLAPEHPVVTRVISRLENKSDVQKYINETSHKTERTRQEDAKDKTGVELKGVKAINPANGEEIPIWVADYVLGSYGTGAIMAVPAHDERDFAFAKKFGLPVNDVLEPETGPVLPNEQPRKSIVAIVEDPETKKFLTLNWGSKLGGTLFIGGGREEGEDEVTTAIREISEETGYAQVAFIEKTGVMHHHYFAFAKNVSRNIEVIGLHFRLTGKETVAPQREEQEKFTPEWLSKEEVLGRMEDENHLLAFRELILGEIYTGKGLLKNSGQFDGLDSETAKWKITEFVKGTRKTQYRIRDWSVSRQRYWGVPIPMIHCPACGIVPVPLEELPVILPPLADFRPKGMPPLAAVPEFINVKCPKCGNAEAKRDPETLDTFVDSSWYYLRYTDPHNDAAIFDPAKAAHWLPVDLYVIGAEHTVLHLLYSRFITKFLQDEKLINFSEPFLKLRHQGLIRGTDGAKMSKSKGNVVNPDEIVAEFGADTVRMYEMFMGPFEDGAPWEPKSILGIERFLKRFWRYFQEPVASSQLSAEKESSKILLHKTIKKVGEDIAGFKFNTAISALMILLNQLETAQTLAMDDMKSLLKIIHPFAPHMAQELWSQMTAANGTPLTYLDFEPWPQYDSALIREEKVRLALQINGKTKDVIEVAADMLAGGGNIAGGDEGAAEATAKRLALENDKIKKTLNGAEPKKVIYVDKRLVNIVI